MPTVRIQEKNYSESIMVLKLKDGYGVKTERREHVCFVKEKRLIYSCVLFVKYAIIK